MHPIFYVLGGAAITSLVFFIADAPESMSGTSPEGRRWEVVRRPTTLQALTLKKWVVVEKPDDLILDSFDTKAEALAFARDIP